MVAALTVTRMQSVACTLRTQDRNVPSTFGKLHVKQRRLLYRYSYY